MALTFHPDDIVSSKQFVKCQVHRSNGKDVYLDLDGYVISLPHCHSYNDVVEVLSILQDSFEQGLTLVDCINH